ncbi:hypothetical protein ABK040_002252 [Willaertia magna]
MYGSYEYIAFITESGKLFTIGKQPIIEGSELQLIPQTLFNNELVIDIQAGEYKIVVLTNYGNLFIFENENSYICSNFKNIDILQIFIFKENVYVITKENKFYLISNEQQVKELNLSQLFNVDDDNNLDFKKLIEYLQVHLLEYEFQLAGEETLKLIVTKKIESKSIINFYNKLHNLVKNQQNNYFSDILIN